MATPEQYHLIAGVFIARVFLGFLFFFQGYDAVFRIKMANVISALQNEFYGKGIPQFLTAFMAWFTSYTALICGLMLVFGLATYIALFLLGINLIVASVGFGLSKPMWDMKHAFPRLALILLLLFVPHDWHHLSIDHIMFNHLIK